MKLINWSLWRSCFSWAPGAPWLFPSPGFGEGGGRRGVPLPSCAWGHGEQCVWLRLDVLLASGVAPLLNSVSAWMWETGSQFLTNPLCIWRCWAPLVQMSYWSAQPGGVVLRVFCCSGTMALWKAVVCAALSAVGKGGVLSALSDPVWYYAPESCSEEEPGFQYHPPPKMSFECFGQWCLLRADGSAGWLSRDASKLFVSLAHSPKVCNLMLSLGIMLQTTESPTAWVLTAFIQPWRSKKQSRG